MILRKFIFARRFAAVALILIAAIGAWTSAVAQVSPDQGLLIFHRADKFAGKAIRFNIEQDGRPIGQLLAGTTLEVPLAPGTYTFTVRAPSLDGMDYLTLNIEAGKTYSVEGEVLFGWPTGRPKFSAVSESGVATTVASSPPVDAQPTSEPSSAPATSNARQGVDVEEAGRLGLRNFSGDWNMEMWSLASDGRKLEGKGTVQGTVDGEGAVRIVITEFESSEFPEATGGGRVTISHEPGKGFILETAFRYSDEILRLTGGYQAGSNTYVFYLIGGPGGQTATGIDRTSVRLEVRSLGRDSWVAATFADVDGQSTQVQSSRFVRR